jgi:endonuclease YncB( thermonuclease family)
MNQLQIADCRLRNEWRLVLVGLCLLMTMACQPAPDTESAFRTLHSTYTGKVVAVSDGDTIEVQTADSSIIRVRLHGVDAPEKAQAFGKKAKQLTSDLVFDQKVVVRVAVRDRYGRVVGEVFLPDGRSLNRELLAAGLAWWYRDYSRDETLASLEASARAARRGLWVDEMPAPPWEWRHSGTARR